MPDRRWWLTTYRLIYGHDRAHGKGFPLKFLIRALGGETFSVLTEFDCSPALLECHGEVCN